MNKIVTNKSNELIRKRKKAIRRRRAILFLIFFFGIMVLLTLKTSYFLVKKIVVENNKIVPAEEIVNSSGINETSNILYLNIKDTKERILTNAYIQQVNIKRQLPSTLILNVTEREAKYYIQEETVFYILDKNLNILEKRTDSGLNLIEIKGSKLSQKEVGKIAIDNNRTVFFTSSFIDLMNTAVKPLNINSIDITDTLKIQLHMGNMVIKIGDEEQLKEKLNKVMNILEINPSYAQGKGYIDVSFNGNPVISIEK